MDALAIAGLSMQNDLSQLNTISQNLANVLTPAYKREIQVSRAFDSHVDASDAAHNGGSPEARASVSDASVVIDPAIGTLRATSNPLDVAIESKGFLEVMTDNGVAYTRQGNLHLDSAGRLTNGQGFPVSGMGGDLHISGTGLTIDHTGTLQQAGKAMGQLKLVQFTNPQLLEPLGNGLFGKGGAQISDAAVTTKMKSGFLEASNVSSPQEMIKLTETVRHFESMQKVFQGYDDVFQKAITKLGDF